MMRRTKFKTALIVLVLALVLLSALLVGIASAGGLKARNLPPDGKVLFIMGQDGDTLTNYKAEVLDVDPSFAKPGGITLYTNLSGAPLSAMWTPVDFEVGRSFWEENLNEYDGAFAVGLEFVDYANLCNQWPLEAVAGTHSDPEVVEQYRGYVDELIMYLKMTRRPVYLRIGYEFDGTWNCYAGPYGEEDPPLTPEDTEPYKNAFRYIAQRIDELKAKNIATVWQSATWPGKKPFPYDATDPGHWDLWYPGDDVVDWMGLSTFYGESFDQYQWNCDEAEELAAAPRVVQNDFLDYARAHNKPVMIAEAAPQGFDLGVLTAGPIFRACAPWENKTQLDAETIWTLWFEEFFGYIEANRDIIRAVAYINADWDTQHNWECTGWGNVPGDQCRSGYWGDSRIQANPDIYEWFKAEISKPIYVQHPRGVPPFDTPDFSKGRGVYEAEYADAAFGWIQRPAWGQFYGEFPLPERAASNNRHVMLLNYLGWGPPTITFENVRKGSQVTVRYSAINDWPPPTEGDFTLLVNGEEVATHHFELTGGSNVYEEAVFEVDIPNKADVSVRLDTVSAINLFIDKIEVSGAPGLGPGHDN